MIEAAAQAGHGRRDILVAGVPAPLLRWTFHCLPRRRRCHGDSRRSGSDQRDPMDAVRSRRPHGGCSSAISSMIGWADILRHGGIPADSRHRRPRRDVVGYQPGRQQQRYDCPQYHRGSHRHLADLADRRNILIVRGEDFSDPAGDGRPHLRPCGTAGRGFVRRGSPHAARPLPRVGQPTLRFRRPAPSLSKER